MAQKDRLSQAWCKPHYALGVYEHLMSAFQVSDTLALFFVALPAKSPLRKQVGCSGFALAYFLRRGEKTAVRA